MHFRSFLNENINPADLNGFLQQAAQWRQTKMAGGQQNFTATPQHTQAIQNALEVAKQKLMQSINGQYRQVWPQYKQWETEANRQGIRWGIHATSQNLGPAYKVGPLNLSNPGEAVVPQDFYNLLYWRAAIQAAEGDLKEVMRGNQNSLTSLATWLRKLSALIK